MEEKQAEKSKQFPTKLVIVSGVFILSGLAFALSLKGSIATVTLTTEGLLACLPALICFFLVGSLAVIFSLVTEKKIGLPGLLVVALIFGLSLTVLPLPWRFGLGVVFFVGLLFLRTQALKIHEAYVGFSASYYRSALRSLFFVFIFALALLFFLLSRQALEERRNLVSREALEPIVGPVITMFGGLLEQEFGGDVPEEVLAPAVEEMASQLLGQLGMEMRLEGQPTSLSEVTTRISTVAEENLLEVVDPFRPYVPFVLAGLALFTLAGFYPLVMPVGMIVFFIAYRLLLLARILKLQKVERTAKRLVLA